MSSSYRIGVDGGGSKTECILIDAQGEIVARHVAPGCNPSIVGSEKARALLDETLRTLVSSRTGTKPEIVATLLCMAGSPEFWKETASSTSGYGKVEAVTDALPVLELATDGKPGIALHAGTGSFVVARAPDGSIHYAGGLGWRFGDEASAYDLGRRAVARALLEAQGWIDRSDVGRAVAETAKTNDPAALSRHFYAAVTPNQEIAAIAPRITVLADAGDPVAKEIVQASVQELAHLALAVAQKLFPGTRVPCGVSGAILQTAHARRTLEAVLNARFSIQYVAAFPIEGVRRLLLRLR